MLLLKLWLSIGIIGAVVELALHFVITRNAIPVYMRIWYIAGLVIGSLLAGPINIIRWVVYIHWLVKTD